MRISQYVLVGCLILFCAVSAIAQKDADRYPLIPYPYEIIAASGFFTVTPATSIQNQNALFKNEAGLLSELFKNSFGRQLPVTTASSKSFIILKKDETIKSLDGYRIHITKQSVVLSANSNVGMFRAIQTVRQLLPASI